MVTDAVAEHEGTVVSFLGDGVMAVFGAPVSSDDHAQRALAAARQLAGPGIAAVNRAAGTTFAVGIGLNSGPVVSGTVGPARRIEYATVGDTTNVAAKVQAHTKSAGHPVLVTAATRDRLRDAAGLVDAPALDAGVAGRTIEVFGA